MHLTQWLLVNCRLGYTRCSGMHNTIKTTKDAPSRAPCIPQTSAESSECAGPLAAAGAQCHAPRCSLHSSVRCPRHPSPLHCCLMRYCRVSLLLRAQKRWDKLMPAQEHGRSTHSRDGERAVPCSGARRPRVARMMTVVGCGTRVPISQQGLLYACTTSSCVFLGS